MQASSSIRKEEVTSNGGSLTRESENIASFLHSPEETQVDERNVVSLINAGKNKYQKFDSYFQEEIRTSSSDGEKMSPFEIEEPNESKQQAPAKQTWSGRNYVFLAIGAGLCYGTQNFLMSFAMPKGSHDSFDLRFFMPSVLGYMLSSFVFHTKTALQSYGAQGSFWKRERSAYFKTQIQATAQNYGVSKVTKLNWFNVCAVFGRTMIHMISFCLHSAVLYYSSQANINFSLIINLYSLTPFFTAIAFYLFFKERLNMNHGVGMLFIFGCVYITSLSENREQSSNGAVSVIIPVTLAITATLCFTASSTYSRFIINKAKGKLSSSQLVADGYLVQSIIMLSLYFLQYLFLQPPPSHPTKNTLEVGSLRHFQVVGGISLFGTLGNYLLNEAIIHGRAGPSQALCEVQSIWMLFLEVAVLGKLPSRFQSVGFVLGIVGGVFIVCKSEDKKGH
ncbi:hypothetical protein FGO68_gene5254 [Halteria grandinella]|uniref:EamA domain-containing protein n=1 Tax=Halteria grandinella TaxID=5974 RepID=A0A8J8T1W8_HALGN|nr:hypothetical protein FGO68_gene5254 [Halteria grandinella]